MARFLLRSSNGKSFEDGMLVTGTITAAATSELLAVLHRHFRKPWDVGARAGLSRDALHDSNVRISLASFTSILEAAAYESGKSNLGLELGMEYRPAAMGPVTHLLRSAKTLGDGLRKFTQFFGSFQTSTSTNLAVSNGVARLTYSIKDPAIRFRAQDAELTLMLQYSMILDLLGSAWKPTVIDFEHAGSDDLASYRKHFSSPIRFKQRENALMFPSHLLDVPLSTADERTHSNLQQELASDMRSLREAFSLRRSVESWLVSSMSRSLETDIDTVAQAFNMSTRSFQRHLASHGVNYFDIRNRVRMHIAKCMLAETHLPITSIALQLGYSETSAFSRGFKILCAQTPAEFRASMSRLNA